MHAEFHIMKRRRLEGREYLKKTMKIRQPRGRKSDKFSPSDARIRTRKDNKEEAIRMKEGIIYWINEGDKSLNRIREQ